MKMNAACFSNKGINEIRYCLLPCFETATLLVVAAPYASPASCAAVANALNQYTQRTVPGYAAVRGEAATNATVTVNERPTFRQGSFFYGGDSADNTTSNLWKELEVYAAINPPGTNTPDVVYASTGTVFVAKTPESSTYDADGNMTSDGRFHYFWNGENRLVCASNADVVVTYAYDHRGRMVRKDVSRTDNSPFSILHYTFVWDDWNIIREVVREGDSVAVSDNVWGLDIDGTLQGAGGVGGLLAVIRSNSNSNSNSALYFPTYDANGNVSEYISTNGEIVAHYDYSPFGEPLVASGPLAYTFTHQFSTKPYCSVTGFSEYQKRKYRSEIGRWMSRDPIGELADNSLMVFLGNDPLFRYDVNGLVSIEQCSNMLRKSHESDHVKTLIEKIRKKGCELPDEQCQCCDENDILAARFQIETRWFSKKTKILVCAKDIVSQYDMDNVMWHEMFHAYQECYDKSRKDKCRRHICREIEAFYTTTCSGYGFDEEARKECVLNGVVASTTDECGNGKDKEAIKKRVRKLGKELYEHCKTINRPDSN